MIDTIIPIQEIKRRGLTAVDSGLSKHEAVTVVRNNRPAYIVIRPEDYEELVRSADEARLAQSLDDWREGRFKATTVDDLMEEALRDDG